MSRLLQVVLIIVACQLCNVVSQQTYQSNPSLSYSFTAPPTSGTLTNGTAFLWYPRRGGFNAARHYGLAFLNGVGGAAGEGTDYINLQTFPDDNGNVFPSTWGGAPFSFEMWVNQLEFNSGARFFESGNSVGGSLIDQVYMANNGETSGFLFGTVINNSIMTNVAYTLDPYNFLQTNVWQHIVVTVAQPNLTDSVSAVSALETAYSNGVLGPNYSGATPNPYSAPLPQRTARSYAWLGKSMTGAWYYQGYFDSFYYYNYALAAKQVMVHYLVPRPPVLDLAFGSDPRLLAGTTSAAATYSWEMQPVSSDPYHTGILQLSTGQYVNLSVATGPSSVGTTLPVIGGVGSGNSSSNINPLLGSGWTFEANIEITTAAANAVIFQLERNGGLDVIELEFGSATNSLQFVITSSATSSSVTVPVTSTATTGVWYYIVLVATNTTATVYVNGVVQTNVSTNGVTIGAYQRPIAYIGYNVQTSSASAAFWIESMRIYDYALTTATIVNINATYSSAATSAAATVIGPINNPYPTTTSPTNVWTFDTPAYSVINTDDDSNFTWVEGGIDTPPGQIFHYGLAQFDGLFNGLGWLDLTAYPDVYGNVLPAIYGGSMSWEFWVQWINVMQWARIIDLAGPQGPGDNNVFLAAYPASSTSFYWCSAVYNGAPGQSSDIDSLLNPMTPNLLINNFQWVHVVLTITQIAQNNVNPSGFTWSPTYQPNFVYYIASAFNTSLCVTGSTEADLYLQPCVGNEASQQWNITSISFINSQGGSGLQFNVYGGSCTAGSALGLWPDSVASNTEFSYNASTMAIVGCAAVSKLCVTANTPIVGGTGMQTAACVNSTAQQWLFGTYTSGATAMMYINGQQLASTSNSYTSGTGGSFLPNNVSRPNSFAARSNWPADARFQGVMDLIAYYPYALDAEAIQAHSVITHPPLFEITFATNPTTVAIGQATNLTSLSQANYGWLPSNTTAANNVTVSGVLSLNLNGVNSQYVNLSAPTGPTSIGVIMPIIGGTGSGVNVSTAQASLGISFEFSFNALESSTSGDAWAKMIDCGVGAGVDEIIFGWDASTGGFGIQIYNPNFSPSPDIFIPAVQLNRWYHVVVVIEPIDPIVALTAAYTFYVDGVIYGSGALYPRAWPRPVYRANCNIGKSNWGDPYWVGQMNELRIYDYALSSDAAARLYDVVFSQPLTVPAAVYNAGPTTAYTFDQPPNQGDRIGAGTTFTWTARIPNSTSPTSHYGLARMIGTATSGSYTGYINMYDVEDSNFQLLPSTIGGPISFETWVYYVAATSQGQIFDIGSGASTNNILLGQSFATSNLFFNYYPTTVSGTINQIVVNGTYYGSWQHIVYTNTPFNVLAANSPTAATSAIYINGQLVSNVTGPMIDAVQRTAAYLGISQWTTDGQFDGYIDSFYYYNYALSAEAVPYHYILPRPPFFEATFSYDPRNVSAGAQFSIPGLNTSSATYGWELYDPADVATNLTNYHRGIATLNAAQSQFINLCAGTGPSSIGTVMGDIGGPGYNQQPQYGQYVRGGWSFEVIFKPQITGTSYSKIIDFGNGPYEDNVVLSYLSTSQTLVFQIYNPESISSQDGADITLVTTIIAGQWYHVVVTVQPLNNAAFSSQLVGYVNGYIVTGNMSYTYPLQTFRTNCYLGKSNWGDPYMTAIVDKVAVYDYVLTYSTVQQLYAVQAPPRQCGIGPYSFSSLISSADLYLPNSTATGPAIYLHLCGAVTNRLCTSQLGYNVMVCQYYPSNGAANDLADDSEQNPVVWSYVNGVNNAAGIQFNMSDGAIGTCSAGQPRNVTGIITCGTSNQITSYLESPQCNYQIALTSPYACSAAATSSSSAAPSPAFSSSAPLSSTVLSSAPLSSAVSPASMASSVGVLSSTHSSSVLSSSATSSALSSSMTSSAMLSLSTPSSTLSSSTSATMTVAPTSSVTSSAAGAISSTASGGGSVGSGGSMISGSGSSVYRVGCLANSVSPIPSGSLEDAVTVGATLSSLQPNFISQLFTILAGATNVPSSTFSCASVTDSTGAIGSVADVTGTTVYYWILPTAGLTPAQIESILVTDYNNATLNGLFSGFSGVVGFVTITTNNNNNNNNNNNQGGGSGLSHGAIAGIVIGCVCGCFILLLVVILCFTMLCRDSNKRNEAASNANGNTNTMGAYSQDQLEQKDASYGMNETDNEAEIEMAEHNAQYETETTAA